MLMMMIINVALHFFLFSLLFVFFYSKKTKENLFD